MNHLQLTPASLLTRVPVRHGADMAEVAAEAEKLGRAAQYGWGHTIDFGAFRIDGLFGDFFLHIAGGFDSLGWWPRDLAGLRVADIGCYTGGLSVLMAERGAGIVYAVDEVPENLAQCAFVARTFGLATIKPVLRSVYALGGDIEAASLDLIVCSGVLYHLSDMLAGLHQMKSLLKPGGTLLLEGDGVDDLEHSYANFGRFVGGMWWQPSALCVRDMCEFMGFADVDIRFYQSDRFIARATATDRPITYRRGINARFDDLKDRERRPRDPAILAPAPRTGRS